MLALLGVTDTNDLKTLLQILQDTEQMNLNELFSEVLAFSEQ